MPENIRCTSCETTLLAFESIGPEPIGHEACPECGSDEFEFVQ